MLQPFKTIGFKGEAKVFIESIPRYLEMNIAIKLGYATQSELDEWVEYNQPIIGQRDNLKFDDIYRACQSDIDIGIAEANAEQFGLIFLPCGIRQIVTGDAGCMQILDGNRPYGQKPYNKWEEGYQLWREQRAYRAYIDQYSTMPPLSCLQKVQVASIRPAKLEYH